MTDPLNHWKNPKDWPKDRSGQYVSLFEATIRIGAALFQDEWSGTEPYAPSLYKVHEEMYVGGETLITVKSNLTHLDMKQLYCLLFRKRPDLALPFPSSVNDYYNLTDDQIRSAALLASVSDAQTAKLHDRMDQVIEFIAEAVSQKKLEWALARDGQFTAMHSTDEWREGRIKQRFFWGMMNPLAPYSPAIGGDGYAYIFFSKRDIDRLVSACSGCADETEKPNKVNRTVKANVPAKKLQEWADKYFSQFEGMKAPTHATAEAAYRQAFPEAGTTQFRKEVWPNRPLWMQIPRAPKGW
ncbi:hypothetical protein ABE527_10805 [Brucella sp. TWI432]